MRIKVASLFNFNTLSWDISALSALWGLNRAVIIFLRTGSRDKLMFTWSKNDIFSVKAAYQLLTSSKPLQRKQVSGNEMKFWNKIWKTPSVLPKIHVFFLEGSRSSSNLCCLI